MSANLSDGMAQHAQFNLVYDGAALQQHTMDVRSLAPALLAMGTLIDRANEIFNGTQTKVAVNVRASFKSGSFGIDLELAQSLWQRVLEIAGSPVVVDVANIAKIVGLLSFGAKGTMGLVKLVKWLRGRGIKQIIHLDNDGLVKVVVDDDHAIVEERVIALLHDYRIRRALEDIVEKPLAQPGIETVAFADEKAKEIVVTIEKNEAHYFIAPPPQEEQLDSTEYVANLQVLNLAFADGNKWRFTEGGSTFYATMLDGDFMRAVASNKEVFAKDDLIRARVRRIQRVTSEGLKADYEILQVIEHRSAAPKVQLSLALDPPKQK